MTCRTGIALGLLLGSALLAVPAVARADRLILTDGRTITGSVTVEGNTVTIKAAFGTLQFSRQEVARIEMGETPRDEFEKRRAATASDDADALLALAAWAEGKSLPREAGEVYQDVLKINPDHPVARKKLGFVRIDGKWRDFADAMELARSKLETGNHDALLSEICPALTGAAPSPRQALQAGELTAMTLLRAARFAQAAESFKALAAQADPAPATRYLAIADILSGNKDGMYVLKEKYPPDAEIRGARAVPTGPASLADPLVLQAALWDRAKEHIAAGRKIMDEARAIQETDPDTARTKYLLAGRTFDKSDALVEGISRSYRIEIARRQIVVLRRDSESNARKFDLLMESLGSQKMSPAEYRNTVVRLIHYLDNVREDLTSILALAKPYAQELALETKWAELDLQRIEEMRRVLKKELDGRN